MRGMSVALLGLGIVASCLDARAFAQKKPGKPNEAARPNAHGCDATAPQSAAYKNYHEALKKEVSLQFVGTPLTDVLAYVENLVDLQIQLDHRALDNAGLDSDTPVTISIQGVSLRAGLRHLLGRLDLVYVFRDEVMFITTPEETESHLETRVFPARDLFLKFDDAGNRTEDPERLVDLIITTIQPNTWDEVGGPGSVEAFEGSLVVSQTQDVLEQICPLLQTLRKFPLTETVATDEKPRAALRLSPFDDETPERIEQKLSEMTHLDFLETPLGEVAEFVAELHHVPVLLDVRALENAGLSTTTPVTIKLKGVSLRSALRLMLRELDLTYHIRDEVLLFSTPEEVCEATTTVLYPVVDILPVGSDTQDIPERMEDLIDTIITTVQPSTWDEVGGIGSLAAYPARGVLICSQSDDVHEEIVELLAKLRAAAKVNRETSVGAASAPVTRTYALALAVRETPAAKEDFADIPDIVQRVITPDAWNDEENAPFVRLVGTKLIVYHRPQVQRRIERLLIEIGVLQFNSGASSGPGAGFF
ncbi:MAG: hypothetical protein KDA42_09035 [Planctomycetales bacterium]|nr:hypothetical protein [Planctomycetales bacterium]